MEIFEKFVLEDPVGYTYGPRRLCLGESKKNIVLGKFSPSEYIFGTLKASVYKGSKAMKFLGMLDDSLDCFAIPDESN